jgi:hypothetical protein
MNNLIPANTSTMSERLQAMISLFLDDSNFDPFLKPLIERAAKTFLKKASEEDIRAAIIQLQKEILPFVLGEAENETPNQNP